MKLAPLDTPSDIRRMPAWLRNPLLGALFAIVLVLLTLRGLHPVQPLTLALFLPIVLVYGWAFERAWHARSRFTRTLPTSP
jgi:hypothetical protein